jgi:hypothetical protein
MLRENSQQLDLLFDVQLVNGCADFDYAAHAEVYRALGANARCEGAIPGGWAQISFSSIRG